MICRDRAGAYAEGARAGAPEAVQVADRFHLWQNLGKAVERCVASHRACLRPADAAAGTVEQDDKPEEPPPPEQGEGQPTGRFAERARRHHKLVHDLLAQGHSLRGIARHLGWGFRTVHRYAITSAGRPRDGAAHCSRNRTPTRPGSSPSPSNTA
jgi:Transposase